MKEKELKEILNQHKLWLETIVLKRNGNIITAYQGKNQAKAVCSPQDQFDMATGCKLAIDKLFVVSKCRNKKYCIFGKDENIGEYLIFKDGKIVIFNKYSDAIDFRQKNKLFNCYIKEYKEQK